MNETQVVLAKRPGKVWWGGVRFNQVEGARTMHLVLTPATYVQLGNPDHITVTLQTGDVLPHEDH